MRPCDFCDQPVDTDDTDNYVQVTSWVSGPKLDGPKLRLQTGRVAHKDCVDRVVAGQAPGDEQPDLFEPVEQEKSAPQRSRSTTGRLCDAFAKKGTGTGMCGARLDQHGVCPRAEDHILD
jgi:hypothetical protein